MSPTPPRRYQIQRPATKAKTESTANSTEANNDSEPDTTENSQAQTTDSISDSTREQLRGKTKDLPLSSGVYLMKNDKDEIIYVGKAKELRRRVSSYFNRRDSLDAKTRLLVSQVHDFDTLETESEVDALVLESRLIKDIQPKYNVMLKDDKTYPYIAITNREDYPIISVTRDRTQKKTAYYGPFTDVNGLRAAVRLLQRAFRFRTCTMSIHAEDDKLRFQRPCLLYHIKHCTAPCAGKILPEDYKKDVQRFKKFLMGKRKGVIKELEAQMKRASTDLRYEEAANYRDQLRAISSLSKRSTVAEFDPITPMRKNPSKALGDLQTVLQMSFTPRTVEGIDIAHLQGDHMVASTVFFVDGEPFKAGYRRYKLKTVKKIDDYASMKEIVQRRYTRLNEEGEMFPDVLLIDGGKGQLSAVIDIFREMEIDPPVLVALAKKEETLYQPNQPDGIKLPRNSAALQLLQQVRDEAHRFAQHYHKFLRRKSFLKK